MATWLDIGVGTVDETGDGDGNGYGSFDGDGRGEKTFFIRSDRGNGEGENGRHIWSNGNGLGGGMNYESSYTRYEFERDWWEE